MKKSLLLLLVCLSTMMFSQQALATASGVSGCELAITTATLEDQVVLPFLINANMWNCPNATSIQLYYDGTNIASSMPNSSFPSFSHVVTAGDGVTLGHHRFAVQVLNSSGIMRMAEVLYLNVSAPPSSGCTSSCTGVVDIWNPTGCPTSASCAQQETVLTTAYVDARVYSNISNIAQVQAYLDGVQVDHQSFSGVAMTDYHSAALSLSTSGNPHRIVVQAVDSGSNVVAKTATYVNATSSPNTFANIEDQTPSQWGCYYVCNPTGVTNNPPIRVTTPFSSLGLEFLSGKSANDTTYWWYDWSKASKTPTVPVKMQRYTMYLNVSSTSPQGLEFESQQQSNAYSDGNLYISNYAFQDDYHDGQRWRSYDYLESRSQPDPYVYSWQPLGLDLTGGGTDYGNFVFAAGQWYQLTFDTHLDMTQFPPLTRNDAITITNCGSSPPPCSGTSTRYRGFYDNAHYAYVDNATSTKMTHAIQDDVNSSGTQYHVNVDTMTYTYTE